MSNFYMLVGLPASGKSTYARELAKKKNAVVLSSDNMREELFGNRNEQTRNAELFEEIRKRAISFLNKGRNVIFDATNISYKKRRAFLDSLRKVPCTKTAILIATPFEECIERNKHRENSVPKETIERMYKNFTVPYYYEGFDEIHIHKKGFEFTYGYPTSVETLFKDYDQKNSHHDLTLGEHLRSAFDYAIKNDRPDLAEACILHDCGKPRVASSLNAKGEDTGEYHYYNHQNTSAYDSLFFETIDPLKTAVLIQWHMQPYFIQTEKQEKKYKALLGEDMYNDILFVHKADS